MMKKSNTLFGIFFLTLLSACSGVIGNIERYPFYHISRDSLKKIVARVNLQHPVLKDFDTSKYKEGQSGLIDGDYYCRIKENGKDIMLMYAYPHYPIDTSIEITLISGGNYHGIKPLAKDISSSQQRYYKQLFEKHFIRYVQQAVGH